MPLFLYGGPGDVLRVWFLLHFVFAPLHLELSRIVEKRLYSQSHQELPFRKLSFSGFSQGTEKLNGDSVSVRQAGGLNNTTNNKTLSLHILKCQKDFLANDGMEMIEGLSPSCCN